MFGRNFVNSPRRAHTILIYTVPSDDPVTHPKNIRTDMKRNIRTALAALVMAAAPAGAAAQEARRAADAVETDWQSEIPRVVWPDTAMTALYYNTWELASGRVRRGPEGLPASPYLDENCYEDQIWIWDSCFMVLFSKYAPKAFPGRETLDNLYAPIHDHVPTPLLIHLRDNPPLFAWTELENFTFTADTAHLRRVLCERRYLQRHFAWFDSIPKGHVDPQASPTYNPIHRGVVRDARGCIEGYTWKGGASGMDNTPRGRDAGGYDCILWVDAIAQQALSARCIAELCSRMGRKGEARQWQRTFSRLRRHINSLYWDERDGYYYDISRRTHEPCRVMTPASFWVMLAGVPSRRQAERMARHLLDERELGGPRPWNSLARTDPDYDAATGNYWRGGVWLPMAYMGTKALERYGLYDLADSLAARVVRQQLAAYRDVEPHTIWECYNPEADLPSTEHGRRVRPNFCGWSALGPISLFIENIMGFRRADGTTRTLRWDLKPANGTHGLRNFRFGDIRTDLIYDAATGEIEATANAPYTLRVNGRRLRILPGTHRYRL